MGSPIPETSVWDRREAARRYAAQSKRDQVESRLPEVRRILSSYKVTEAYVFGSMATGEPRPESDVDLAVAGSPVVGFYRLSADLERALELPLDLVDLDRAPPAFAMLVRETGRRILP
jgi:predicted nucleotidyltransferase